jgi:hypothetical protein
MTNLIIEVPKSKKEKYEEIFTVFIKNYSIEELEKIQENENLYKKLSSLENEQTTKEMNINETNKYLDNFIFAKFPT